jgi:hypothetical protein
VVGLGWVNIGAVVQFQNYLSVKPYPEYFMKWKEEEGISTELHPIASVAKGVMVDEIGFTFGA